MKKYYFMSILVIFCAILIETSILSNIIILPAIPDLALLCVVYFSVVNGKIFGEVNGFFSGVLLDFLSGAPLGFNCLYRTLIGYLLGTFGKSFSFDGFLMPSICAFLATALKVFIVWIISLLFPNISTSYKIISFPFLFELVSNIILAPFIFKFLKSFRNTQILKQDL